MSVEDIQAEKSGVRALNGVQRRKEEISPLSAFTYATFQRFIAFDRPKGVQIISNIHFQYGCFIRLEKIDRLPSAQGMEERPTEGRMTRQNARS